MRSLAVLIATLCLTAHAERIEPVDSWPATSKPDTWVFDFGTQRIATTHVELPEGTTGTIVIRQAEELMSNRLVRFNLRSGPRYHEERQSTDGPITIPPRSFRYVETRGTADIPTIWIESQSNTLPPHPGTIEFTEGPLNDIIRLTTNAALASAVTKFQIDESRPANTIDAWVVARPHLTITGDRSVTSATLKALPNQSDFYEHAILYPNLLLDYLMYSGDRATTLELTTNILLPLLQTYATAENEQGLLNAQLANAIYTQEPKLYLTEFDTSSAHSHPNFPTNAFYLQALRSSATLFALLDIDNDEITTKSSNLEKTIRDQFWNAESSLYNDTTASTTSSYFSNIIALHTELIPPDALEPFYELTSIRKLDCSPFASGLLIEGWYKAGHPAFAEALLLMPERNSWTSMTYKDGNNAMEAWNPRDHKTMRRSHTRSTAPFTILMEHVLCLKPTAPGWTQAHFAPQVHPQMGDFTATVRTPRGRIHIVYDSNDGYEISAPPGLTFTTETPEGKPVTIFGDLAMTQRPLTPEESEALAPYEWTNRTEGNRAVWVSVDEQRYRIIEGDQVIWEARCATATNGTGSESGSMKTPLGWHRIVKKLGSDAPWGQVFRSRAPTREIWKPGDDTSEDLVLTRVLLLDGEEPGKNKGGNVDSRARYIYVHGTNDEERIGQPSSHGCIRLRNDDVITAFNLIEEQALLLITER